MSDIPVEIPWYAWVVLGVVVIGGISVDLFLHRKKHEQQSVKQAALQTLMWVGIGVVFGIGVWLAFGSQHGGEYFSAWIVEYSLSVDNIFVWGLVLTFFAVPAAHRHRLLFWGVFGALVMRGIFIVAGVTLVSKFEVIMILLGAVLIWSAIKILRSGDDEDEDFSEKKTYKFFVRILPIAKDKNYEHFVTRENGRRVVTVALLALLMVEVTDLIFAVDSVPAVLAISSSTFVIYASNAMAIMGLRSLYFVFDAIKDRLSWMPVGIAIVLGGIGVKMILANETDFGIFQMPGIHVSTNWSLAFIGAVLTVSVLASIFFPKKEEDDEDSGLVGNAQVSEA